MKLGKVCKLKKPLYGLNAISQKFWLKVKEVFNEYCLKILRGYQGFYHIHDEKGNFDGMVSSHVDDFILAGTDEFLGEITRKILKNLRFQSWKMINFDLLVWM